MTEKCPFHSKYLASSVSCWTGGKCCTITVVVFHKTIYLIQYNVKIYWLYGSICYWYYKRLQKWFTIMKINRKYIFLQTQTVNTSWLHAGVREGEREQTCVCVPEVWENVQMRVCLPTSRWRCVVVWALFTACFSPSPISCKQNPCAKLNGERATQPRWEGRLPYE